VVGNEDAKSALYEAVVLPVLMPHLFTSKIRSPVRSLLLHGPPGTGKTLLAKATAGLQDQLRKQRHVEGGGGGGGGDGRAHCVFLMCSPSALLSKWTGEGERLVKVLFALAKQLQPSLLFIDEIDSLSTSRDDSDPAASRLLTELLVQMSSMQPSDEVTIIGATNRPDAMDPACLRRFEKKIYVPLPNEQARGAMIQAFIADVDSDLTEEQVAGVAQRLDGWSGADIEYLVRDASMMPIREITQQSAYHPSSSAAPTFANPHSSRFPGPQLPRALCFEDFFESLKRCKATSESVTPSRTVMQDG
jgi:SpoVK/Ycf46/Vps4 family AAA+-type ATPase